ncbi:MAG: ABC transporter ATP-binding protein [Planctomycetota bacterium]
MSTSAASNNHDQSLPPLQLKHVVKTFGDGAVTAVDQVDLTIEPGTLTAIMGRSGSGKSTLLHLAAGLTRPDEGHVEVAGEDLATMDDRRLTLFRRRQIGLVFQSFNLIPTLDARENVALPLTLDRKHYADEHGDASPSDRATQLLGMLGLEDRVTHRPDAMSGGEQQRVAIARALAADPALVLADEPTGNLDSANGEDVCVLLRGLVDQGRTIVMVTHEPAVAAFATRTVVMKDGRVVDDFAVESGDDGVRHLAERYQSATA